jgi:hypothetical protein
VSDCIRFIFIMLLIPVVSETPTGISFIYKRVPEVIVTTVAAVCVRQPPDCRFISHCSVIRHFLRTMEWAPPPRVKSLKQGGSHGRFSWTPLVEELLSMLFGKPPVWVAAPPSTHGGYKPHWGMWPAESQPFLHAGAVSPLVLHPTPIYLLGLS